MKLSKGKLIFGGTQLTQEMITPKKIICEYYLDGTQTATNVVVHLRNPIHVPDFTGILIKGLEVSVGRDGRIMAIYPMSWN